MKTVASAWIGCLVLLVGCKEGGEAPPASTSAPTFCASGTLEVVAGTTGSGSIFYPDPIISSLKENLSPGSIALDTFRVPVTLEHLGGRGVLEGQFVDVRNGAKCGGKFGAYDRGNQFIYSHSDSRFQEVMAYHAADQFRAHLDEAGQLEPKEPLKVVVHCTDGNDNAYYLRYTGPGGQKISEVCIGDSTYRRGASYADDAAVPIHELQHATTAETYSSVAEIRHFPSDEGGALDEAISDFMALAFFAPTIPSGFDPRVFSRWALGSFQPQSAVRGAHRCPAYDSDYPNCGGFPAFSADSNTISYVYPDGVGWPYANNFSGPAFVRSAFVSYTGQEEIHNSGMVVEGALWDAFDALRKNYADDGATAQTLMTKLVLQAVGRLPMATRPVNFSPVTFRGFASAMVAVSEAMVAAGQLKVEDQAALIQALTQRGLYGTARQVPPNWLASAGDADRNVRVQDSPSILKAWLGPYASEVTHGIATGMNSQLDPGEVAVIWFDLRNEARETAGGVYLKVMSLNPSITFLDSRINEGFVSPGEAHAFYHKVNGTDIVAALTGGSRGAYQVPTGNSYFQTNPFFDRRPSTGLWIRVSSGIQDRTARFRVEAVPTNGATASAVFEMQVR